jgi:hypothetical protein
MELLIMANQETYNQSPFNKLRKDRFLLVLNVPDALKKINSKFTRTEDNINLPTMQFSVYGCTIPEIIIPQTDIVYGGQTFVQSSFHRPLWEPVTVNFTVDNRMNNYWVIYSWLNLLNDAETGIYDNKNLTSRPAELRNIKPSIESIQEYSTDISIFLLDEYDKRVVEFLFKKSFPTSLGGMNLNYRTADEIETSFTFAYSQFIVKLVENVDNL